MPAGRPVNSGRDPSGDLAAHNVVRRLRDGRVVLDGVTGTFAAGRVTLVIGGNGAGKSTLARVLAGVDRPDGGTLARPASSAYFLPERVPVLASCSTRVVAAALGPALGRTRSSWQRRLAPALADLGFTHDADTPLHRLSKGNVQKAYLAIAYALSPAVVVLDEPTTGTDPASRAAVGALLRGIAADGGVVVVTAHRPVLGADLSLELADGRLRPYVPPRPAGAAIVSPGTRRYLVDLVLGAGGPDGWTPGPGGDGYEIVSGTGAQKVLRLLVIEHALPDVLRRALDRSDAVVRVVEDSS